MADLVVKITIPDAISTKTLREYSRATNYPEQVPNPADPSLMIDNPVTKKQWMALMWAAEVKSKCRAWREYEYAQGAPTTEDLDTIVPGS